jgi:hypothetical protein
MCVSCEPVSLVSIPHTCSYHIDQCGLLCASRAGTSMPHMDSIYLLLVDVARSSAAAGAILLMSNQQALAYCGGHLLRCVLDTHIRTALLWRHRKKVKP